MAIITDAFTLPLTDTDGAAVLHTPSLRGWFLDAIQLTEPTDADSQVRDNTVFRVGIVEGHPETPTWPTMNVDDVAQVIVKREIPDRSANNTLVFTKRYLRHRVSVSSGTDFANVNNAVDYFQLPWLTFALSNKDNAAAKETNRGTDDTDPMYQYYAGRTVTVQIWLTDSMPGNCSPLPSPEGFYEYLR